MDTTESGRNSPADPDHGSGQAAEGEAGRGSPGQVVDVLPAVKCGSASWKPVPRQVASAPPAGHGRSARVLGMKTGDGPPEIQLQFLQTIAPRKRPPNSRLQRMSSWKPCPGNWRSTSRRGKAGEGFTATVEKLLKALPDDPAALPRAIRGQLLSLLQTGLRSTEKVFGTGWAPA